MQPKVIVLIYGAGGHRAQMERLLGKINPLISDRDVKFLSITETAASISHPDLIESFELPPFRSKYFSIKKLLMVPKKYIHFLSCFLQIKKKYRVISVISTGPGLAIPFSILFKLARAKIIFIETWSRFETQSYAGKVMYRVADRFYIQNESLARFYPKAIYSGLL